MLDTGASICIVPPSLAAALGLSSNNRITTRGFDVVGGKRVTMDVHRMKQVRVGSAEARNVPVAVAGVGLASRYVLLGLSFIGRFDSTTVDFDGGRVLFRSRGK
jgi:predicted aspartyl protease